MKYIVVTGGVLSGLGKGVVAASVARLFSDKKIVPIKCDGYLNVDPGTMNPVEHGEVFVQEDGGEVDMDFGHYERIAGITTKFGWNLTSGKVLSSLIEKERRGEFLGKTVQIVPHVVDEIKEQIKDIGRKEKADVVLVEIGGTVGDLETEWFVEALRRLRAELPEKDTAFIHLVLVPCVGEEDQQKTKPAQMSIQTLREKGIVPDIIVGRCKHPLSKRTKQKFFWLCGVREEAVISDPDTSTIYELPLIFEKEGLARALKKKLKLKSKSDLSEWKGLVKRLKKPCSEVTIAIGGKYTELHDSYASVIESLSHAGAHHNARVKLKWVETTNLDKKVLEDVDGLLVPGGFGSRGTEGKIKLIKYARKNNVPFLGLCFGLQLAVIEYARNVCGLEGANSTEMDPDTRHPVIDLLPEQKSVDKKGATMRLGAYEADLAKGSIVSRLYKGVKASERHRHRYEVNPEYHERLTEKGLLLSGTSQNGRLAEFIELPGHRFFVATQAHPELKSRLESPAPLFYGFIEAALKDKERQQRLEVD